MENLSFTYRLDLDPSFDDGADTRAETAVRRSEPPPADRATSLFEGLSAYAAVFGCSAGCTAST